MKRKLTAMLLVLAMACCLTVPAMAEMYDDAWWEDYNAGWDAGYDAGLAAAAAGDTNPYADVWDQEDLEDGYQDGYEEGFDSGFTDYFYQGEQTAEEATQRQEDFLAHGATAGQVNVMLNGACIDFSGDAWPENLDGRVMVPARTILEELGAEVSWEAETKTMSGTLNGKTVTHVIGSDVVSCTENEETSSVEIDCKSYIKQGRTMVPVRFISEALGYSVDWDSAMKTVVILDTAALAAEIDANTTILNRLAQQGPRPGADGRTVAQTGTLDAKVTVYDSIDGDQTYNLGGTFDALASESAVNFTFKLNLKDLVALLKDELGAELLEDEEFMSVMPKLERPQVDFIYDLESGGLYFRSDLFDAFAESASEGKMPNDGDPWYDMSGVMAEAMLGMQAQMDFSALADATVGEAVVAVAEAVAYESPFYRYDEIAELSDQIIALLGDQNFTKSGSGYTLKLDTEALTEAMGEGCLGYYGDPEYLMTMTITPGSTGWDYKMAMSFKEGSTQFILNADKTGNAETMTMTVDEKNVMKAEINLRANTSVSRKTVKTAPDASEKVIDWEELESL